MGASRDDFVKYPRTPHLFGSSGTDDDKHLGQGESARLIADESLIVEAQLDQYVFEVDIYDKQLATFLDLKQRLELLEGTNLCTVPVLHRGPISEVELQRLIGPSRYACVFENPLTGVRDSLMEGLYVRTEAGGQVTARAKLVRPEFTERVKQSEHWQQQAMVPNQLREGVDI